MKFVVDYFGCRSNQAEIQEWIIELEKLGYELTSNPAEADFGILNTCSVTARAEKDVLRFIGRAYRNTNAKWFIVGCTVAQDKSLLSRKYSQYVFLDNNEKKNLVGTVCEIFPANGRVIYHSSFKSRIFLKVQDGCNFRCSFCLVPFLRGNARSLTKNEAVARVKHYTALGYQEVVLTGINLSAYGYDLFPRETLLDLLAAIEPLNGVEVIRLSSLDPRFIKYHFVKELRGFSKIADSFHFSLQSGNDAVIRRMNRGGKSAEYQKILTQFRKFFPDANLGADIIAGFPGESEREFRDTMAFIQSSPLNYLHIFPFSPRPGTKAALLDTLPPEMLHARTHELQELNSELKLAYRERFRGRILPGILIEENPNYSMVITRNFLSVRIPPVRGYKKRKLAVRIGRVVNANLCEGEIA
ncbi:MAG: MiaB/RimO family radical SAM methylthiotransferase [Candidatus Aminicenantes bacterium]|nr:MiaB/RimO family radical SAM methylthiotransferase [Candidatus Aminicenantes bacterium]